MWHPRPQSDPEEPRWQLQEAKQRFSELARRVEDEGPQIVTKHGDDALVVLSIKEYREYRQLKESSKPDFKELLMGPPYIDDDLDPGRPKDLPRLPDFALEDHEQQP